jgi:hypothetical protein
MNDGLERWLKRVMVAAVLAMAAALLAVGVTLYAGGAVAAAPMPPALTSGH